MQTLALGGLQEQLLVFVESPGFAPAAFVVAFLAGAAHALGPGHGKSLAAAYLVGSAGRVRDAAWLGGSVAVMHTVSVLVIAVAWTFFSLSDLARLERLTSALQLLAGLMVVAVGCWLLRRHRRSHDHGHNHPHEHLTASSGSAGRPGRPGLVLLGVSGGLTPSPAAFLVLVTGLFLGRSGFAIALVMAFGLGLAVVLFVVGLLALVGKSVVVRAAHSRNIVGLAIRVAPLLAAGSITLIGCAITSFVVMSLATAT